MNKMQNPEWFQKLPDNAQLRAKEVQKLFGYSEKTNASRLIASGSIPKHTHKSSGFTKLSKYCGWEVKYLRGFIE